MHPQPTTRLSERCKAWLAANQNTTTLPFDIIQMYRAVVPWMRKYNHTDPSPQAFATYMQKMHPKYLHIQWYADMTEKVILPYLNCFPSHEAAYEIGDMLQMNINMGLAHAALGMEYKYEGEFAFLGGMLADLYEHNPWDRDQAVRYLNYAGIEANLGLLPRFDAARVRSPGEAGLDPNEAFAAERLGYL